MHKKIEEQFLMNVVGGLKKMRGKVYFNTSFLFLEGQYGYDDINYILLFRVTNFPKILLLH